MALMYTHQPTDYKGARASFGLKVGTRKVNGQMSSNEPNSQFVSPAEPRAEERLRWLR